MKMTFAITAASLAGLTLSPAFAQTSTALYGVMDTGLVYVDNVGGSSSTLVRSGNMFTSRFGFRGTEDLGGGLRATFNLEAGLNVDTGAGSTPLFNRQSWVGLSSTSLGTISMGRMLPIISDLTIASLPATHFGNPAAAIDGSAVGAGSSVARFNNLIGGTRIDNTIKYRSPTFSGFTLLAQTSLGEVAGSTSAGRSMSVGGGYNSNNFEAGVAYHERKCSTTSGCRATEDKDKILGVVGAYKLNDVRYSAIYTSQKNALNVRDNDADVVDLIVRVPFNQWSLAAGVQFLNDKTPLNQDARQLNLAVNYPLSKRTELYTLYSHQSVKRGGRAGMYSLTSSDDKQSQLSLGMLHRF